MKVLSVVVLYAAKKAIRYARQVIEVENSGVKSTVYQVKKDEKWVDVPGASYEEERTKVLKSLLATLEEPAKESTEKA